MIKATTDTNTIAKFKIMAMLGACMYWPAIHVVVAERKTAAPQREIPHIKRSWKVEIMSH